MAAPQAAGCFNEVGEEDITRLRGMTLFDKIKQMQHLCCVATMIVSPSGALSGALSPQLPRGYNHGGNTTEMLHLFNISEVHYLGRYATLAYKYKYNTS